MANSQSDLHNHYNSSNSTNETSKRSLSPVDQPNDESRRAPTRRARSTDGSSSYRNSTCGHHSNRESHAEPLAGHARPRPRDKERPRSKSHDDTKRANGEIKAPARPGRSRQRDESVPTPTTDKVRESSKKPIKPKEPKSAATSKSKSSRASTSTSNTTRPLTAPSKSNAPASSSGRPSKPKPSSTERNNRSQPRDKAKANKSQASSRQAKSCSDASLPHPPNVVDDEPLHQSWNESNLQASYSSMPQLVPNQASSSMLTLSPKQNNNHRRATKFDVDSPTRRPRFLPPVGVDHDSSESEEDGAFSKEQSAWAGIAQLLSKHSDCGSVVTSDVLPPEILLAMRQCLSRRGSTATAKSSLSSTSSQLDLLPDLCNTSAASLLQNDDDLQSVISYMKQHDTMDPLQQSSVSLAATVAEVSALHDFLGQMLVSLKGQGDHAEPSSSEKAPRASKPQKQSPPPQSTYVVDPQDEDSMGEELSKDESEGVHPHYSSLVEFQASTMDLYQMEPDNNVMFVEDAAADEEESDESDSEYSQQHDVVEVDFASDKDSIEEYEDSPFGDEELSDGFDVDECDEKELQGDAFEEDEPANTDYDYYYGDQHDYNMPSTTRNMTQEFKHSSTSTGSSFDVSVSIVSLDYTYQEPRDEVQAPPPAVTEFAWQEPAVTPKAAPVKQPAKPPAVHKNTNTSIAAPPHQRPNQFLLHDTVKEKSLTKIPSVKDCDPEVVFTEYFPNTSTSTLKSVDENQSSSPPNKTYPSPRLFSSPSGKLAFMRRTPSKKLISTAPFLSFRKFKGNKANKTPDKAAPLVGAGRDEAQFFPDESSNNDGDDVGGLLMAASSSSLF